MVTNKTLAGIAVGATLLVGGGTVILDQAQENNLYTSCDYSGATVDSIEQKLTITKVKETDNSIRSINDEERIAIKTCEFIKMRDLFTGVYEKDGMTIEIVGNVALIDGGVQVFARAWRDGNQLGFGYDGTVDIERFKILNPPVLVDDPKGSIVREWTNLTTGEVKQITLREDPKQALIDTLFRTAEKTGKDGSQIVQGKIGHTTSLFYSSPGATSPVDGYAGRDSAVSYGDTRSGAGEVASAVATILATQNGVSAGTYAIYRSPVLFDTSSIPDTDTVTAATLSITTEGFATGDSDGTVVDTSTPGSNSNVVASDHNIANWGGVAQSDSVANSALSVGGTSVLTLNATGLGNILKTGITKFGLRSLNDLNNTTPTANPYHYERSADYAGTASDPVLTVTHSDVPTVENTQNNGCHGELHGIWYCKM